MVAAGGLKSIDANIISNYIENRISTLCLKANQAFNFLFRVKEKRCIIGTDVRDKMACCL